jgi:hypothetical protein
VSVSTDEWLRLADEEYLRTFIREGGSSVRFVVGEHEQLARARERIAELGRSLGYHVAQVGPADAHVHRVDELFAAVARRIPWAELAESVATKGLLAQGYQVPEGALTFDTVAQANGIASMLVRRGLQQWLSQNVFRDYRMVQPFRAAMMLLCLDPLDNPQPSDGGLRTSLIDWLTGQLRLVSEVRQALIFEKIARHNARDMFLSTTRWIRVAGRTGIVITLDISEYPSRHRTDGQRPFTRLVLQDLYEMLRQFIDATDEFEGLYFVVTTSPEFVEDETRGFSMYRALEARIAEEVRDIRYGNPLAALVRLVPEE